MTRRGLAGAALALAAFGALPFLASSARGPEPARCDRDGVPLEALFRVRVATPEAPSRVFCTVRCAEDWLARSAAEPVAILVLDEPTGEEIDAAQATFVESALRTSRRTGERIHAFRRVEDALAHVQAFGGRVLAGHERPFGTTGGA